MTPVLAVLLGILYVIALVTSYEAPLRSDELVHFSQIHLFRTGQARLLELYLTMIPGFHALVAALEALLGSDSPAAARIINAGFGLVAAAGFHALRRRTWPETETVATAQFLVLPILVPLFFLIYTDVLALALLLWALVATLSSRHWLAVAALVMLLLVRQHYVVWAVFAGLLALDKDDHRPWGVDKLRGALRWAWPYVLPVAGFFAFWVWNGSISLSPDQAKLHPLTLRLGNPFFALLLLGLLFPLHVLAGLRAGSRYVWQRPWLLLLPLALFSLYWWGFRADNPYNAGAPELYPRNALVLRMDALPAWRAGAGILMVLATCGLASTKLQPRGAVLLYPFAGLFLAASWLIEQRYALVPIVLWLAFREHRRPVMEWATFALWLLVAVYVVAGIHAGRFFP